MINVKETAKLLCILCGYDVDFDFNIEPTDDIANKFYTLSVQNHEGDEIVVNEFGAVDFLHSLLNDLKESESNMSIDLFGVPLKSLMNDDYRKLVYEYRQAMDEGNKDVDKLWEGHEFTEESPCINCKRNKKDHWDIIHYKCEECHCGTCPELQEFNKRFENHINERVNTPEYKDAKERLHKKLDEIQQKMMQLKHQTKRKHHQTPINEDETES